MFFENCRILSGLSSWWTRLASMRMQVWSLAALSRLRIWCYPELWCRSQTWFGSALLWLWCRLAAIALIRPLAWEPPYAMGAALERLKKKKKKKRKEKKERRKKRKPTLCITLFGHWEYNCQQYFSVYSNIFLNNKDYREYKFPFTKPWILFTSLEGNHC